MMGTNLEALTRIKYFLQFYVPKCVHRICVLLRWIISCASRARQAAPNCSFMAAVCQDAYSDHPEPIRQ